MKSFLSKLLLCNTILFASVIIIILTIFTTRAEGYSCEATTAGSAPDYDSAITNAFLVDETKQEFILVTRPAASSSSQELVSYSPDASADRKPNRQVGDDSKLPAIIDGRTTSARFYNVTAFEAYMFERSPYSDVYLVDGPTIRLYTLGNKSVVTIAGSTSLVTGFQDSSSGLSATFSDELQIARDTTLRQLLVSDRKNHCVRSVSMDWPHAVTTVVGQCGTSGSATGPALTAMRLNAPQNIITTQGDHALLVDSGNSRMIAWSLGGSSSNTLADYADTRFADTVGVAAIRAGFVIISKTCDVGLMTMPGGGPFITGSSSPTTPNTCSDAFLLSGGQNSITFFAPRAANTNTPVTYTASGCAAFTGGTSAAPAATTTDIPAGSSGSIVDSPRDAASSIDTIVIVSIVIGVVIFIIVLVVVVLVVYCLIIRDGSSFSSARDDNKNKKKKKSHRRRRGHRRHPDDDTSSDAESMTDFEDDDGGNDRRRGRDNSINGSRKNLGTSSKTGASTEPYFSWHDEPSLHEAPEPINQVTPVSSRHPTTENNDGVNSLTNTGQTDRPLNKSTSSSNAAAAPAAAPPRHQQQSSSGLGERQATDLQLSSTSVLPMLSVSDYARTGLEGQDEETAEEVALHNERRQLVAENKYHRGKLLGRGANGTVYVALLDNGSSVAMKEVHLSGDEGSINSQLEEVAREINLLAELRHRNLVIYYKAAPDRGSGCVRIFMELVTGGSLGSMVRGLETRLPESVVKRYIAQVLDGLFVMHARGIVHRDLKGDNILVDSTTGCVKIADFGTARSLGLGADASRAAQTAIGTPYFMAPEIILGRSDGEVGYGVAADIWSLGIMVCELLDRGTPPWPAFNNPGMAFVYIASDRGVPNVPTFLSEECRSFIARCCDRDPTKRATAQELMRHPWIML